MIHCVGALTHFRRIENDVPRDFGVSFVYTAGGLKRDIPRPGGEAVRDGRAPDRHSLKAIISRAASSHDSRAEVARDVTKDRELSLDVD